MPRARPPRTCASSTRTRSIHTPRASLAGRRCSEKMRPAAIRAFRAALASQPPDKAVAHYDLAQAYLLGGQSADAKRETLEALDVAPSFEPAQDLLLKIVGGGKRY